METLTTLQRLKEMSKQASALGKQLREARLQLSEAECGRDKGEREVRNLSRELTSVRFRLDATEAHLRSLGFIKENAQP